MLKKSFNSPQKTKKFAADLAKKLVKIGSRRALILGLSGDLGSGKTTFVQGFLRALGVRHKITSPTFVLIKHYHLPHYQLPITNYRYAYHIDCYRVKKPSELLRLDLKEILDNPQDIVLIEWAEKIKKILPKGTTWLKFGHTERENGRIIRSGSQLARELQKDSARLLAPS